MIKIVLLVKKYTLNFLSGHVFNSNTSKSEIESQKDLGQKMTPLKVRDVLIKS